MAKAARVLAALKRDGWAEARGGLRRHATLHGVHDQHVRRIAELLRERNAIDDEIAAITRRPMTSGHLGEWIASQIFHIQLEATAVAAGIDGNPGTGRCRAEP